MLELAKQASGLKLLQWTKELPSASAGDPLGLSLRVSARLANEFSPIASRRSPRGRATMLSSHGPIRIILSMNVRPRLIEAE